ncbi:CCA tRNA nucleotidyltransferase [Sulfidibacter corallicola]|uniref:CCA tRNA nucleotidyltransferase n=1 Tax=Sulfidibacter corallicola TaxID=2818388 RepID=A0A8A4TRN6_SULCO|nr:CCA tRNA nucleotidyltransferase [Sulfidibacter corallicola]QTD52210.1 CCA tRNA nucleotidyltransferase [Sulfidibacter corallicola]
MLPQTTVLCERHREALDICRLLDRSGFQAMLAGGCVRDLLLAREPKDFDIACTAEPRKTLAFFQKQGFKTVPVGIEHGTVAVITPRQTLEITTLREDVVCHGRHAEVAFSTDFATDAQRRDFTINALFQDAEGRIHDFVGGVDDLEAQRLRFVGDADARIHEDYLRILRYFRFLARFEWQADVRQLEAVRAGIPGLTQLSAERIHKELNETFRAPGAAAALDLMIECGVLQTLAPATTEAGLRRALTLFSEAAPLSQVLAWFTFLWFGSEGRLTDKPLQNELSRLRFTRKQTKTLRTLVDLFQVARQPYAVLAHLLHLREQAILTPSELRAYLDHHPEVFPSDARPALATFFVNQEAVEPPRIPTETLLEIPRKQRGAAVEAVKISWYLGILGDTNQVEQLLSLYHETPSTSPSGTVRPEVPVADRGERSWSGWLERIGFRPEAHVPLATAPRAGDSDSRDPQP